jgi:hypothetical protein
MLDQQNLPVTDTPAAGPHEEIQTPDTPPTPKRNCGRTGPTSETGKATSSRNATRHGLCSSTLIIAGETEEDWENLLASWLTEYQNPPENSVLYTFVVKTAQAEWFRQRAQNEFDYFLAIYAERAMCSWDAQSLKTYDLLLRYVTAGERKFQREYRALEHHWKAHPHPAGETAQLPTQQEDTQPEPDPSYDEMPLVLFVNNETGDAVDAQGNHYPAPPDYVPTPIIPGVYPPGHLCYHEPAPTSTRSKRDRQRR